MMYILEAFTHTLIVLLDPSFSLNYSFYSLPTCFSLRQVASIKNIYLHMQSCTHIYQTHDCLYTNVCRCNFSYIQ